MNNVWVTGLLLSGLVVGCTCASSRVSSSSVPEPETATMDPSVETIARSDLKTCLEEAGQVALVAVETAEVLRAGTRGEQAVITVRVETLVYGTLEAAVQLTRYTSGQDKLLQPGRRYMVAVTDVPRFAPRLLLGGFVEVPAGEEAASVEAHRLLITDLGY